MWVRTSKRRSAGVLLTILACAGCTESATRADRRVPAAPAPSAPLGAPEPVRLEPLARTSRASEPVRILEPREGAVLDAAAAGSLAIRVSGPLHAGDGGVALVLSLDGERPRPLRAETLAAVELVPAGTSLGPGSHDLVLAAVDAGGVAIAPAAGGVASVRFFVGARPAAAPPPRVVCLAPFGTIYGKAPRVALDFVVAGGATDGVDVTFGADAARTARAEGPGPFALGALSAGDHELVLAARAETPALPGRCVFTVNPELERSP